MSHVAELAAASGIRVVERGSEEYIAFEDAARFIDEVGLRGHVVPGIEGFRLEAHATIPIMEASTDFSALRVSSTPSADSIRASRTFLHQAGRAGMYCCFALTATPR